MLTTDELALVRDEIGSAVPPTDASLHKSHDELGSWRAVALRVLKRRRADLAGSEVASVTLPGVAAVSLRSNVAGLDRQIVRLEAELAAEAGDLDGVPGARVGRVHRRGWR